MNWDQIKGQLNDLKGVVREKWGKLNDNAYQIIAGKKDRILGKLLVGKGLAKEAGEKQIERLFKTLDPVVIAISKA